MSLSLSGSRSRSRQTIDQTQTNTLSDRAANQINQGIAGLQGRSFNGTTAEDIARFQNPYTQDVVDATMADLGQQRGVARAGLMSDIGRSGAFGDKRRGILEAELEGNLDRSAAATLAGLRSAGYSQALGAAQNETGMQNQYDLAIQQLINQLRGGFMNEGTSRTQGTQTGRSSQLGFSGGFTYGGG